MLAELARRPRRSPVPAFVAALLAADEPTATALSIEHARRAGSRAAVLADLHQVALQEIAERWYEGLISAATEAAAALLAARVAQRLSPTPSPRRVARGSRCLLLLPPGERHTLGARLLTLALEDEGWSPETVTSADWNGCLDAVAARPRPRFVGISAGHLRTRHELVAPIRAIRAMGLPVLVGGAAFRRAPDLWEQVGASGWGADARMAAVLARRWAPAHPGRMRIAH